MINAYRRSYSTISMNNYISLTLWIFYHFRKKDKGELASNLLGFSKGLQEIVKEMKLWPPSGLQNAIAVVSSHGGLCRGAGKGEFTTRKSQIMEKLLKHR